MLNLAELLDVNLLYFWIRNGVTMKQAILVADKPTTLQVRQTGGESVFIVFADMPEFNIPFDCWHQFPNLGTGVHVALKRHQDWASSELKDGRYVLSGYLGDGPVPGLSEKLKSLLLQ